MTSIHLWGCLSTFLPKYFLQNIKNSWVAKRTIHGKTLGRPLDSWVAIGNRATVFQQHCYMSSWPFIWHCTFILNITAYVGGWTQMDDVAIVMLIHCIILSQRCASTASLEDICAGKFEIVLAHPEALLNSHFGQQLLDSEDFVTKVSALVVDECHTIEEW